MRDDNRASRRTSDTKVPCVREATTITFSSVERQDPPPLRPRCCEGATVRATLRAPNGTYYFCEGCQRMWYQEALPGTSGMSDEQHKLLRRLRQIFGDSSRSSVFC